ncbi:MAG: hypothetical protein FJ088_02900, partial [Deltaproteobacteria bacterium]|nr:hypothetical protein [Deltaproteobacteria bacterium]
MSKRFGLVFSVLALFVSTTVLAQTVPVVDRGLTLGEGKGEVGIDFMVGLDKGAAAKRFSTQSSNVSDRYDGVSFAYGLMNELDLGLALYALNYIDGPGAKFGGGYLYGKYAFAEFVGVELGVRFPGEKFGDNRATIVLGVPFKYVLSPGQFALHARPDLWVGLAKGDTPQLDVYFSL